MINYTLASLPYLDYDPSNLRVQISLLSGSMLKGLVVRKGISNARTKGFSMVLGGKNIFFVMISVRGANIDSSMINPSVSIIGGIGLDGGISFLSSSIGKGSIIVTVVRHTSSLK